MRAKPLSILIATLLGLAAAPPQDEQDPLASDDPDAAKTDAAKVPLDDIRRYVMVYNAIRQA